MTALLHLTGVGRRFGGLEALRDVALEVEAGTRHAVIGPNGAGKTTLLNLIAGALPPTGGTVLFDGHDITGLSMPARARRGISRTWQHPAIFPRLTVYANLDLALRAPETGVNRSDRRGRRGQLGTLLEHAGLAGDVGTRAGALPYGRKRRLELAMALAQRPRLLLLDEPSAGLDPIEITHLIEQILALPAAVTVLLVDHNLDLIWSLAHTVTVLHHGRLLTTGSIDAVRTDPKVQSAYLTGTSPQNPRVGRRRSVPSHPGADISNHPRQAAAEQPEQPVVLRVRDLRAGYHGAPVLLGVDLDVRQGEALAVLGRNGAGKTTLLATLAGLVPPYAASRVELIGRVLPRRPRPHHLARAGLALVPQGRRLFGPLTVAEHLRCAAALCTAPATPGGRSWTVEKVLELLPALATRMQHRADRLSGGEQQMLAIARALLTNPRVLLLDEPSEGLAPSVIAQLTDTISTLVDGGLAVLIAEQNLDLATAISERVLILSQGRIAVACPTHELYEPAQRACLQRLLGVAAPTTASPALRLSGEPGDVAPLNPEMAQDAATGGDPGE
ncbi:ATP-binding cassette domain-containing protein [Micromonospora sp. CPCC 206061]|uniref:ATP-binding cassette domain-containing protein n=1 Tax=Micromonospora sp. CPCC 206061 TaxID=3122410 RepID=UPI002FEF50BC